MHSNLIIYLKINYLYYLKTSSYSLLDYPLDRDLSSSNLMEAFVLPNMQSNMQSNMQLNQQPSPEMIFNAPLHSFMMVNDKKDKLNQNLDLSHAQQTIQIPILIAAPEQPIEEAKTTIKRFKI